MSTISLPGPAFVVPPLAETLAAYILNPITGLLLADPAASALAAAGQGGQEQMALTLSVASGVLLLPGLSELGAVSASGVGTAQILLSFTASQLPAVNALLAGLYWVGPAAISGLGYAARNLSGPLGASITSGNMVLNITGPASSGAQLTLGVDAAWLGPQTLKPGSSLNISQITSNIGGISGAGAVSISPQGALAVPYNALTLGGTSYNFGALSADTFTETGALLGPGANSFSGLVSLASGSLVDFSNSFVAGGGIGAAYAPGLSLSSGALLTGSGTLVVGNFSQAGQISGTGTILAGGGETLSISAGLISGVSLQVSAGGVLVLGPPDPLFGVFTPTALTLAASSSISFLNNTGGPPATGAYADKLAPTGGTVVLTSPQNFTANFSNFAPGDRLIFPGLSGLTLLNISIGSFEVAGVDASGITQLYTINASTPLGTSLFISTDSAGDGEVMLRNALPDISLGGLAASLAFLTAMPGVAQPLMDLGVLAHSWSGGVLAVTLSVANGLLTNGASSAASLTISAANPTALNADLAVLSYTANPTALADELVISSASTNLAGLAGIIPVLINPLGGTIINGFADAGQVALFTNSNPTPLQGQAAPGELIVTGAQTFDDTLKINGLSGTALQVSGGIAFFDSGAAVQLGASATIGAGGSAGQLDILTPNFSIAGNLSLAAGGVYVGGQLGIGGTLTIANPGSFNLTGTLVTGAATISPQAGFTMSGQAVASFGQLNDTGFVSVFNQASLNAGSLNLSGTMELGGEAVFSTSNNVASSGTLVIGPGAQFSASAIIQNSGSIEIDGVVTLSGVLTSTGAIGLNGGTLQNGALTLNPGAVLAGGGTLQAGTSGATILLSGGSILATGNLLLNENINLATSNTANPGVIEIASLATLDAAQSVTGGTISFSGAGAELVISSLPAFSAAIAGMVNTDAVDLSAIAPAMVTFANGLITTSNSGGFALAAAPGQSAVSLLPDGQGGTLITLGGDMPCFARGTRLLTPNGYRPVEHLSPNDPVITRDGAKRAVRWIGRRTLDLASHPSALPVRFAAHALGPSCPAAPVVLSPLHAVFFNGILISACHLVNGATITRELPAAVTYYHIELDRHDILLAEGMQVESYLDTGNRSALYHETGQRGHCRTACAPLITSGSALARIRWQLHEIALAAGFTLTYTSRLRAVAGASSLLPRAGVRHGKRLMVFKLPPQTRKLNLTSLTASPAETDPNSSDRRALGICLAKLPPHTALGPGWFPPATDDAGTWMSGAGVLNLSPPATNHPCGTSITLALAAIVQSWQTPDKHLARARHSPPPIDLPARPS